MSSGNLHETIWKQEKSIGQLLVNGQRSLDQYSRILQGIIADDDIRITPKAMSSAKGWYHIKSNFGSAKEALDACACPVRWNYAKTPDEIPMIVQPIDALVKPVLLGTIITRAQVYEQFGSKLADPNKLFTFGANYPKFQEDKPVFTLWKDGKGQLWYAYLYVDGGERYVSVGLGHPGDEWHGDCCVLVCE